MIKLAILMFVIGVISVSEVKADCECTDLTTGPDHLGRILGRCLTKINDQTDSWCYVSSDSTCEDKKQSLRQPGLYYSVAACETYLDSAPQTG